jgi:sec-independent protein translocase protein TatA
MPNIGPLELAIVLIIALVIFGPKRLPELGRSLGNGLREFKSSVTGDNKDDDPPEIENGVEDHHADEPTTEARVEEPAAAERERERETQPGS